MFVDWSRVDVLDGVECILDVEFIRIIVVWIFYIHDYDLNIKVYILLLMNQHWKNVRANQINSSSSKSTYGFPR